MLKVDLSANVASRPPRYLFLGAHCDDIEIGCGGTILKLAEMHPEAEVSWVVFSSNDVREQEARRSAARFLKNMSKHEVQVLDFRNSFFPQVATQIKEHFEVIKKAIEPDVVFTHYRGDLHQDHRTIGDLTWNTFRNHLILEYEIPKYDGGLGSPNAFVDLNNDQMAQKIAILMEEFESQRGRSWFTQETFEALPRIRGIECNAEHGKAEAYYCSKVLLSP